MEYKELAKDAKVMAESFRQDGNVILPNKLEMHATAIEELLARAEKAERERDAAIKSFESMVRYNEQPCIYCRNGYCGITVDACGSFEYQGIKEE